MYLLCLSFIIFRIVLWAILLFLYAFISSGCTVVRKKKERLCKKMNFGEKIIFFDKLNMIDFNIFNMLKLIFTCESVAYLLQNSFVNVSFNSTLFLLVFNFDCLFEDWPVVCLLYFVLSLLDTLFTLFSELIGKLIFWVMLNLSVMIQAKGWKSL